MRLGATSRGGIASIDDQSHHKVFGMAPAHNTGTLRSGDVEIFYRQFGQPGRTPIVIMHGLAYFSFDWIDIAAALAQDREVVAVDMRGFGESGWSSAKNYSIPANAADLIRVLDHFEWNSAAFAGHSMGGRYVTYAAAEYPDRTAALMLLEHTPKTAEAGFQRVMILNAGLPDRFASVDEAIRYYKKDPNSAKVRERFEAYLKPANGGLAIKRDPYFLEAYRRAKATGERPKLSIDLWAALQRVACPILFVKGRTTVMIDDETTERMRTITPRVTYVEVEAGHDLAGEAPAALVGAIQGFLRAEHL
jgi:pimeloyl-ACP methyl ester carboxylesterase